jgi:apolipoprotein D and lipocalin family protein
LHRLILALGLVLGVVLAGCVVPQPVAGFRKAGALIWSSAGFQSQRIAGTWNQVAGFSAGKTPGCAPGALRFDPDGAGLTVSGRLCLNGQVARIAGRVTPAGPGRLSVPGMADWWVIWVDADYRTLAIGTPDGRFGFVLDRGKIGPDRMRAAAEIFDFNGYAKGRLLAY